MLLMPAFRISLKRLGVRRCSMSPMISTTTIPAGSRWGAFGPSGGSSTGFSKYDEVRQAFEKNFEVGLELGAQLVVYEEGKKVIDLHGSSQNQQGYDANTLQCVFSSGKNMEAIAIAMMVDQGHMSYDDLVATHWPEYGVHGKENVTIADVMRHEGGTPFMADPAAPDDTKRCFVVTPDDVSDVDAMEAKLCGARRSPKGDNLRCYHAITRGWLVNGILRRVDDRGRSLGQYVREEIADPLDITYFCGMSENEQRAHSFANMSQGSSAYNVFAQMLPSLLGFGDDQLASCLKLFFVKDSPALKPVVSWMKPPPSPAFNDTPEGRALEISSAGMFANARSMAKVNAVMASGGVVDGVRLLSEEGVRRSMSKIKIAEDVGFKTTFGISQGGFGRFTDCFMDGKTPPIFHPDDRLCFENFMGWGGWGGSLSLWDTERNIAFSYVMNAMEPYILGGKKTRRILLAYQDALRRG